MKVLLPLLCLCAVALAEKATLDKVDAVVGKDTVDKKDAVVSPKADDSAKKAQPVMKLEAAHGAREVGQLPDGPQAWGVAVNKLAPSAEVYATNLAHYSNVPVKPSIAAAYDLEEELAHWMKEGNPQHLQFLGDDSEPVSALVSANQPVLLTNYKTDTHFHFFNKYDENDLVGVKVDNDLDSLVAKGWEVDLPVKIIVHGFTNTVKSPAIQLVKNAFLKTGKYNVIAVDWGKLCRAPWYQAARVHVSGVGAKVGDFVDALVTRKLTDASRVHIIGHSLGAHVAGIAAKSMTVGKPKRVTGLDPAGPLFQLTKPDGIIWRDDADLVDIIHTNAGYLGKSKHLGHVDFFPNGGHFQPGCPFDVTGSCSHARSFQYFASTIRNKRAIAGGLFCPKLPSSFQECIASKSHEKAEMGYPVNYSKEGAYYIKTTDQEPYEFVAKV